jgi:hypothetical protein
MIMPTVVEIARDFYKKYLPDTTFDADLIHCMEVGYVICSPNYFLMGWPTERGWFVRMAVGDCGVATFLELMPYYLPYVGWARVAKNRDTINWYKTEVVAAKLGVKL